jgi:predicted permease
MVGVPLVYAAALGLLINLAGWTVPDPLAKAFHLLGQGSVPTMLIVLGIKLAELVQNRQNKVHVPAVVFVTVARLLVAPALAWLLAEALGLQGMARNVAIVEAAMPTAVITTILATEFETDSSFAALCVLVTTLISLPTLTILLNLLQ